MLKEIISIWALCAGSCYKSRTGDCSGNDLEFYSNTDKAACDALCNAAPDCAGYTYSFSDGRLGSGGCITKSADCSLPLGQCDKDPCFYTKTGNTCSSSGGVHTHTDCYHHSPMSSQSLL